MKFLLLLSQIILLIVRTISFLYISFYVLFSIGGLLVVIFTEKTFPTFSELLPLMVTIPILLLIFLGSNKLYKRIKEKRNEN